ncbi:MAG: hypothetical protein FWB96_08640 [Defluviitaleaceae bacterium]|nr:hypothetical protein [Defluviitaleaceae bacterium]MCL2263691.1 hypothetical protein [Defluviitaleaceae bacterium]
MGKMPVWQMIYEAALSIANEVIEISEIKRYIKTMYPEKYNDLHSGTINAQITICCVNNPTRLHYPENKKPRIANGKRDFLYRVGRGQVAMYNPEAHGLWEIANIDGKLQVRRTDDNEVLTIITPVATQRAVSPKNKRKDIPPPSIEQVKLYLDKWETLENYTAQESALNKLFGEIAPVNNSLDDILIKVATLNAFYSTYIKSIFTVARHILQLDIDARLQAGDENIVDDIANVTMPNGKTLNVFSFATKYCSHHQADNYPIYDSHVKKSLCYFRDVDGFAIFHKDDLRKFSIFKRVILEFRKFYSLENFSIKAIDKYLWQLGKENWKPIPKMRNLKNPR